MGPNRNQKIEWKCRPEYLTFLQNYWRLDGKKDERVRNLNIYRDKTNYATKI